MTVTEAKNKIYRKCLNCKYWNCAVWVDGEPSEDVGMCVAHGYAWRDREEEACKSFAYADWAIRKMIKNNKEDNQ